MNNKETIFNWRRKLYELLSLQNEKSTRYKQAHARLEELSDSWETDPTSFYNIPRGRLGTSLTGPKDPVIRQYAIDFSLK